MDIRIFRNGLGMKKAFDAEYKYKEMGDTKWQYATLGSFCNGALSYPGAPPVYGVSYDLLLAKQTNLAQQVVWGGYRIPTDLSRELDRVSGLLREIESR